MAGQVLPFASPPPHLRDPFSQMNPPFPPDIKFNAFHQGGLQYYASQQPQHKSTLPVRTWSRRVGSSPKTGENFLRRKTPNGTLNAGYHASAVDKPGRGHTSKHLAVSGSSRPLPSSFSRAQNVSHLPLNQESISTPPTLSQWRKDSLGLWPGPIGSWNDVSYVKAGHGQPQVDSALNGFTSSYGVMDWQPTYQHGPNVMQPPYQAPLGPTASSGFHGSNWQHNAFSPFNPSPFAHDHRFFQGHQSQTPYGPVQGQYPEPPPGLDLLMDSNVYPNKASYSTGHNDFGPQRNHSITQDPSTTFGSFCTNCQSQQCSCRRSSEFARRQSLDPSGILNQALSTYRDLVSAVQHARKQEQIDPTTPPNALIRMPFANVFPEPTRKGHSRNSSLSVKASSTLNSLRSDRMIGYDSNSGQSNFSRNDFGFDNQYDHEQRKRNIFPPPDKAAIPSTDFQSFSPHGNYPSYGGFPWQSSKNPRESGTHMLNVLTQMCPQYHSQWTEGMLLAGCLAYVLGEYHNASTWFSRIIEIDSE